MSVLLKDHIRVLDIYVSPPHIQLEVGLHKSMGHGLYSRTRVQLFVEISLCFETQNDNR